MNRISVCLSRTALCVSLFLLTSFAAYAPENPITANGFCKGIRLAGRVRIVSSHEDFRVKVVSSHEDLRVRRVDYTSPSSSFDVGEWRFVDSHEDFTIRLVDSHEDFTIRYVDSHSGVR